jgi:hypoxanthine phosphoribosyltransferase
VLVVDDIVGSGTTWDVVRRLVLDRGAASVEAASIVVNIGAHERPRHHGVTVDDWVHFPWEARPS